MNFSEITCINFFLVFSLIWKRMKASEISISHKIDFTTFGVHRDSPQAWVFIKVIGLALS